MSNESIPNCIVHKDTRNIQVRLDYMLLYRNEAKAKVIRTMETWTDQKRAEWFKLQAENKEQGGELPKEPPEEALWVTMSYEEFSIYAYGTMKRDDIKAKVDDLVQHKYLKRRPHPTMPGVAPQYLLNLKLLQKALDEQEMPSLFEDIGKIRPPRKKQTPREKYPQGRGINQKGDIGKIPPGTGEKSYPSKNTTKNYRESSKNNETIPLSASAEESMPAENIRDFKTESAKLKAVSLHVASSDYQKEEDTGERDRVIRPVLTIGGGGNQHDRNDLSGDWSSLPGAVHDKPHCSLPPPGGVGQTESAGGGQTETAPAPAHPIEQTPDAGTHSLAASPPGDGQDDGTRDQALPALPDAGQVASAPAASTALGVFSPPPTSGVQQGVVGHTPPKPRLKKTVIVKDTAGPPPFPSESDAWGTTTCLRLFDFWRGAPLCDVGQLKYASSCAKRLAETYSRVQVVLVRTAMNNQKFWKDQGGADVCDVARHMGKELNKLKMPVAPTQQQPDQSRPTLDEVECIDPTWCVYQRPGDTQEWILWQGELLTEDEANDRGYGGGGGLYKQTQYA